MIATPWLTLAEAADYLKVSQATVRRALAAKTLHGVKVAGRKVWRFHTTELDRWLQQDGVA